MASTSPSLTEQLIKALRATTSAQPRERLAIIRELMSVIEHEVDGPYDQVPRGHPHSREDEYKWISTGLNGEWSIRLRLPDGGFLSYVIVKDKVLENGEPKQWVIRTDPNYWRVANAVPSTFGLSVHAYNPIQET